MAVVEIREHVMAFEPDKCKHCGSLVAGVSISKTHNQNPFSDVTVQYDCGSEDWFSTWTGSAASARTTEGVTGMHVGQMENPYRFNGSDEPIHWPVYMRRLLTQKGECFRIENNQLKAKLETVNERVALLEAEDRLSKERIRMFLPEGSRLGPSEYPI